MSFIEKVKSYWKQFVGSGGRFDIVGIGIETERSRLLAGWTFRAIDAIAKTIASTEFYMVDSKQRKTEENPVLEALYSSGIPKTALLYWLASNLEIYGVAYFWIQRDLPGRLILLPIVHDAIEEIREAGRVVGYVINGQQVRVEDVLRIYYPNPQNPLEPHSVFDAVMDDLQIDQAVRAYVKNFYKRFGLIGGVLFVDGIIDDKTRQRMRREWESIYAGSENAGKILIVSGGKRFQPLSSGSVEAIFINGRKVSRDLVLQLFGVPPAVVGVYEDVNRANAREAYNSFVKFTIVPKLKFVVDSLNHWMWREFPKYKNMELDYMVSMEEDTETQLKVDDILARYNSITVNELRAHYGLDPVSWGDVVPGAVLPYQYGLFKDAGRIMDSQGVKKGGGVIQVVKSDPKDEVIALIRDEGARTEFYFKRLSELARDEVKVKKVWELYFKKQKVYARQQLEQFLKEYYERSLKGVKDLGDDNIEILLRYIFSESEARREAEELFSESLFDPLFRSVTAHLVDIGIEGDVEAQWVDDIVERYIAGKRFVFARQVTETTQNLLREKLIQATREWQTIDQLADNIQELGQSIDEVFDWSVRYRAVLIARTELIGGTNYAHFLADKESGLVKGKIWISARDSKVRPWHVTLDGQVKEIGEKFVSDMGNELAVPGDPNAPCEEICNCRCTYRAITLPVWGRIHGR